VAFVHAPFNHRDWVFELKYDGFWALAYIEAGLLPCVPEANPIQELPAVFRVDSGGDNQTSCPGW
jgi:hypothetical protein